MPESVCRSDRCHPCTIRLRLVVTRTAVRIFELGICPDTVGFRTSRVSIQTTLSRFVEPCSFRVDDHRLTGPINTTYVYHVHSKSYIVTCLQRTLFHSLRIVITLYSDMCTYLDNLMLTRTLLVLYIKTLAWTTHPLTHCGLLFGLKKCARTLLRLQSRHYFHVLFTMDTTCIFVVYEKVIYSS